MSQQIVCDKRGKVFDRNDEIEYQEMFSYEFTGGYGSVFGDGIHYEIDLCQKCFQKLLGPYLKTT